MALTINGKKILGYALGDNAYLSGENLNAFYIDATPYDSNVSSNNVDPSAGRSFTIDMTNYFNQADAKHPDVQYYQILIFLDYKSGDRRAALTTPLLKRGEINNQRSVAAGDGQATTAWFTDKNTLTINTKSMYDGEHVFSGWFAYVYGFTSQDVGSVS